MQSIGNALDQRKHKDQVMQKIWYLCYINAINRNNQPNQCGYKNIYIYINLKGVIR